MRFLSTDVCDPRCFGISFFKKPVALPIGTLLDPEIMGDRYDAWSRSSLLGYHAILLSACCTVVVWTSGSF